MAKSKKTKLMTEAAMYEIIDKVIDDFEGDMTVLESAIGALAVGRRFGWHVLRLMHASRTFKKYEDVLGIKFRDVLPERTKDSTRNQGIKMADGMGKFWKVITANLVPAGDAKIAVT